jgi:hypothetical protein
MNKWQTKESYQDDLVGIDDDIESELIKSEIWFSLSIKNINDHHFTNKILF